MRFKLSLCALLATGGAWFATDVLCGKEAARHDEAVEAVAATSNEEQAAAWTCGALRERARAATANADIAKREAVSSRAKSAEVLESATYRRGLANRAREKASGARSAQRWAAAERGVAAAATAGELTVSAAGDFAGVAQEPVSISTPLRIAAAEAKHLGALFMGVFSAFSFVGAVFPGESRFDRDAQIAEAQAERLETNAAAAAASATVATTVEREAERRAQTAQAELEKEEANYARAVRDREAAAAALGRALDGLQTHRRVLEGARIAWTATLLLTGVVAFLAFKRLVTSVPRVAAAMLTNSLWLDEDRSDALRSEATDLECAGQGGPLVIVGLIISSLRHLAGQLRQRLGI